MVALVPLLVEYFLRLKGATVSTREWRILPVKWEAYLLFRSCLLRLQSQWKNRDQQASDDLHAMAVVLLFLSYRQEGMNGAEGRTPASATSSWLK
jgi:hypothetical protein